MAKKSEPPELVQEKVLEQFIAASGQDENTRIIEARVTMLSLAKDILERNAALQWEQDKTKGLTISCDEIIKEAAKLLDFVFKDLN